MIRKIRLGSRADIITEISRPIAPAAASAEEVASRKGSGTELDRRNPCGGKRGEREERR